MAGMIPLVRCGSIMPFVRWMQANGRPTEANLRAVDLGYVLKGDPNLPIPLGQAIAFLRNASRAEGPDFPARIVSRASVAELGLIGEVALGSGSVRAALISVAASLQHHVTHGMITVAPASGGVIVREVWGLRMDEETRHLVQQYVAALIQAVCANAGARLPVFTRVALVPHPEHGLSHLQPWFGNSVEAAADKVLELVVPARVADRALRVAATEDRPGGATANYPALQGDGRLSTWVRIVVAAMLADGTPTVESLAAASGLRVRTLQRRLGGEGTSFSALLEEVRRDLALAGLSAGELKAGEIADSLGYGQQSSFTRAVRRWTGTSPRTFSRPSKR